MKSYLILLVIFLLFGCSHSDRHDSYDGTFVTKNGIKFQLRADSTATISFNDTLTYESTWKVVKDSKGEYVNIEFGGYPTYYYLQNNKLYRSIREMRHDAHGESVKYE